MLLGSGVGGNLRGVGVTLTPDPGAYCAKDWGSKGVGRSLSEPPRLLTCSLPSSRGGVGRRLSRTLGYLSTQPYDSNMSYPGGCSPRFDTLAYLNPQNLDENTATLDKLE